MTNQSSVDERVAALKPEVNKDLRTEIQHALVTLREAGNIPGAFMTISRSLEGHDGLLGLIASACGYTLKGFNLEKQINELAERGIIPGEIASDLHWIRVRANKARHKSEKKTLTVNDGEMCLDRALCVIEWFGCQYEHGPLLRTIYLTECRPITGAEINVLPHDTKALAQLAISTYVILRYDQITRNDAQTASMYSALPAYEGGWGKSTFCSLEPLFGVSPTPLVRWQGGISTTSLVGMKLIEYEHFVLGVQTPWKLPYLELAKRALLSAQHPNGGFGSLVQTRNSIEPHPTYRHTAAVLRFLLAGHPPREPIQRGSNYLTGLLTAIERGPVPDTCPSMALAWAHEAFASLADQGYIDSSARDSAQNRIRSALAQIDDEYFPLWRPYADSSRGLHWTALSVIIVCNGFSHSQPLMDRGELVLRYFLDNLLGDGVPPYLKAPRGDIGMTAMLALAIDRLHGGAGSLHFNSLLEIILRQGESPTSFEYSWGETLIALLDLAVRHNWIPQSFDREILDQEILAIVKHPESHIGFSEVLANAFRNDVVEEVVKSIHSRTPGLSA
jgi:hypothetical protein